MPRTLTEGEFNAIKSALLDQAPDGLSEAEFQRWMGPRLDGAIAQAENSPAPVSGSALRRFLSGAGGMLNPVPMVTGLAHAVVHPVDTLTGIGAAMADQGSKAKQAANDGRYVEAAGHGLAAAIPVLGPTAAGVGERMVDTGDIATGIGETAGLVAPVVAAGALRARAQARMAGTDAAKLERQAVQQVADQVLAPANPRFKGKAQAIAPEVIRRGMTGSRDDLALAAEEGQFRAGQAIDAAVEAGGGPKSGVIVDPVIGQLEQKIADLHVNGQPIPGTEGRIAALQARVDYLNAVAKQRPQPPGLVAANAPGINPKAISFEDLKRIRDEQYALADKARGYERMGNPALSAEGEAARDTGSAIRQQFGRLSPDLADANADYAFYKTLGDVLDPVQGRPKSTRLPAGVTGGERVSGALAGQIVGGKIGGFVMGQVIPWIKEMRNGPAWQLADAQDKMRLAAAIRAGNVPKAQRLMVRIGQAAVVSRSATNPNESQMPTP